MPTSPEWKEALSDAGASDALEGGRLAELADNPDHPSTACT